MKTGDILDALRAKFPLPEWAGFSEVRDGTGFHATRSIDFWAMNCYPSKGFLSVAVEIKVSRGDFIRELNNPLKRESAESLSRETYFAAPTGLLKTHEIPEGWGLIEVSAEKVAKIKLRAKQRDKPIFKNSFIASIMRRLAEDHQKIASIKIEIEKAQIAAIDIDAHLRAREREHFEKERQRWEHRFQNEAEKTILGEGLAEARELCRKEFGYSDRSLAQQVAELTKRAIDGKLEKVGASTIRSEIQRAISSLQSLDSIFSEQPV